MRISALQPFAQINHHTRCIIKIVAIALFTYSTAWADCPSPLSPPNTVLHPGLNPGPDSRTAITPVGHPWGALGRLTIDGSRNSCTGAMIGPKIVLTAAHCLVNRRTGCFIHPEAIRFTLGYNQGDYRGYSRGSSYVFGRNLNLSKGDPAGADWAIVTLKTVIANADTVIRLSQRPTDPDLNVGDSVALAGYQEGHLQKLIGVLDCIVTGLLPTESESLLILHNCPMTRGTSGAPLLRRLASGEWVAVGVISKALGRPAPADRPGPAIGVAGGIAIPANRIEVANGEMPVSTERSPLAQRMEASPR